MFPDRNLILFITEITGEPNSISAMKLHKQGFNRAELDQTLGLIKPGSKLILSKNFNIKLDLFITFEILRFQTKL